METIKSISELAPGDRHVVERLLGQQLGAAVGAKLILRVEPAAAEPNGAADDEELPSWCNVLEGISDEDLAEIEAAINFPTRLTRTPD